MTLKLKFCSGTDRSLSPPSEAESRGATGLPHSIHHVTPAQERGTILGQNLVSSCNIENMIFLEAPEHSFQNKRNIDYTGE